MKCDGQAIEFPKEVGNLPTTHDAVALLVTAAGTQGVNRTEVTVHYGPRGPASEKISILVPDWWNDGGWLPRMLGQGPRFSHHLDANKAISNVPVRLHVAYLQLNEGWYPKQLVFPTQPAGKCAYYVFAAAVKHDHQWKPLDLTKLYNCDVVGREGVADSGNLLEGTAFDQSEWKREVTVPAPDVPKTRLMDVLPKTTLAGRLIPQNDGSAVLRIENTGAYPAFLTEIDVGEALLAQIIPSDNYFWLAPGETREVLLEKSPAATATVDKTTIRLRAWNAAAASVQ